MLDVLRRRLAPHYSVERELGAGGMATVFLAREEHPSRRVAIKVLDPLVATRLLRERFLREVDLSSKLTHPHIVPIFAAGEVDGLLYYVMPYLEGESLRSRLQRAPRPGLEETLHVARDVADALGYAHAQGVIHRDIKPENVLLSGGHAVVADFGIARAISAAGSESLTRTGQSIGSPAYMSPEQAVGSRELDARTDIYSLGCLLFEMLAGEPPVRSLLDQDVRNWGLLESRGGLSETGARGARAVKHALSTALALLPEERFATADEFAAALGGPSHRSSIPSRGPLTGRRGRRIAVAGAALVALAALAVLAGVLLPRRYAALSPRRVVVAVIENHTGDSTLDNLGHMAADWVTQGLAQTGLVEVVPSMAVMQSERVTPGESHGAGHLDGAGIRALGRETGAGTVVAGAYYRHGDSVQFQVEITDGTDGKILRALDPVGGPVTKPLVAVELVRQRVIAALATLFDPRLSSWAATASQPPSFESYQEFIAGLDRFVQFDWPGAIGHFERAAAGDTAFRLPLIFSAVTHMYLEDFAAAESIAHEVERRPGRLAPFDRSYLSWVLARCRGDRAEALRMSRAMASLAPGSEELYLLAGDAMALNRPREAVDALRALGPDRGFTGGWWLYWDVLTEALHTLGDHRRELKEALEGRRRFPENLRLLTAEVRALAALGRTEDVTRRLGESVNAFRGEGWTPADAMLVAAVELRAHGSAAAADTVLARAFEWLAANPAATAASAAHRYRIALVSYAAGRLDDARRDFERLAAGAPAARTQSLELVAERMGDAPDHMGDLGYLGVIAARQGNREEALRIDRTLEGAKQPYLFGRHTMWRARIHALLGDRELAIALLRDALGQGLLNTHVLQTDLAFESLRDDPSFQELTKPKS